MAATDTGDLGTLTFISAEVVDPDATGEHYIRVRFSLDDSAAVESLTGFLIWHDDEAGSTTPVWVDATSATEVQGDGDSPQIYEVLVPVPLDDAGVATWWETFEEYETGVQASPISKGGSIWDGAWSESFSNVGWHGTGDTFQSYSIGIQSEPMNGGAGWDGPWAE